MLWIFLGKEILCKLLLRGNIQVSGGHVCRLNERRWFDGGERVLCQCRLCWSVSDSCISSIKLLQKLLCLIPFNLSTASVCVYVCVLSAMLTFAKEVCTVTQWLSVFDIKGFCIAPGLISIWCSFYALVYNLVPLQKQTHSFAQYL